MTTPAANGFRTIVDFDIEGPPVVTGIAIVVDYDDVAVIDANLARKLLPGLLDLALNPPKEAP
jgi:hypothetical protein